jgi:hypothetical protein
MPVNNLAIQRFLDGDVGHRSGRRCTAPMLATESMIGDNKRSSNFHQRHSGSAGVALINLLRS